MEIKFTNFNDGVHNFDLSEPVKNLKLSEPFEGDLKLDVKMDKSLHQIVLNCDLTVSAKFECDRCTKDVEREYNKHFVMTYLFGEPVENDQVDLIVLSKESDKIYLDEEAVEYALLAVPMKKLCNDDCKGLCSKCGKDLNDGPCDCKVEERNPIWDELLKLKTDNSK